MKTDIVQDYFERESRRFDAIYNQDKPLGQRLVDRFFRGVILERFRLICNLAPVPGPWSVLDVGCGSGRFSVALALAGARRVLGIDVASSMIDIANEAAEQMHVADRCEFVVSSFLEFQPNERFEIVVATGYFDYLDDPLPHLTRMAAMWPSRTPPVGLFTSSRLKNFQCTSTGRTLATSRIQTEVRHDHGQAVSR